MANLRANNLTGTGGRNALDGSVFFSRGTSTAAENYLGFSGISVGTSDFTIEGWLYKTKTENYPVIVDTRESGNTDAAGFFFGTDSSGYLYYYTQSTNAIKNTVISNHCWNHFALVRASNTTTLYINGVSSGTYSDANDYTRNITRLGSSQNTGVANNWDWPGYLSNVRITIGTAVYTTAFTPPTEKLEALTNTKLLCCQDSDDPTQEATGKTITGYGTLGGDKTEGNLLTNTLDWTGASSSQSTTMPTGWTAGNGAEVLYDTGGTSGGGANRMLRLFNDGSNSYIYQTIPTVIGQKYQIDLWYEAENSSLAIKWSAGTSAAATTNGYEQWTVGTNGDQATRSGTFNASATTTYITFQIISGTDGASVFVDDIQVKAVNPKAPKVLPPVGIDEGVVFDGDTKVNTQGYMYFPTGDTSQRGRGRAVLAGGYTTVSPGNGTKTIEYLQIQSGGNVIDFGDLSEDRKFSAGLASGTRGVIGGSDGTPGWATGTMEYVTIATTSNTTSFGNMTQVGGMVAAHSNNTRGLFFSVWDSNTSGSSHKKHIDYITIASAGNSADFGELTVQRPEAGGFGSSTRGICAGGYDALSPYNAQDTIDYVTIATTGNATDFGNLTVARQGSGSASSSTRGIIAGGYVGPNSYTNHIDYVTIASTGNATDFGDTVTGRNGIFVGNCSNQINGVFAGGTTANGVFTNTIDYVTIATTGNASDFGDLTSATPFGSALTDCHGGLS
jgi:hypothetical protein